MSQYSAHGTECWPTHVGLGELASLSRENFKHPSITPVRPSLIGSTFQRTTLRFGGSFALERSTSSMRICERRPFIISDAWAGMTP